MDVTQAIGTVAGVLTTVAFVPQVAKTWRSGSARDFSLGMLLLFTLGIVLWLTYGVLLGELPIIVPNVVTLLLSAYILAVKLRER